MLIVEHLKIYSLFIELFLCTELSGDEAKIQNKTIIEFNLSKEKPTELKFNIVVLLVSLLLFIKVILSILIQIF